MRLIILILFPLLSFGQLNIKSFGAREIYADNSKYIQRAIDSAVKTGKTVIIPAGNFKVGSPLIVQKWDGDYRQCYIKIVGESTFWNERSSLTATFGDAPLLSIQKGKGCIIEGIVFNGKWVKPSSPYKKELDTYKDPNTRDERYSPYCAIAIDPFRVSIPPDGGYPSLTSYYRGSDSRGGSTGIIVKNCVFNGFTVGAITSPNGWTQNAELITFENIQIINCKIGFAGCQAQEKMNRIINVGAWGTTHTLFCFNTYGEKTPGNWIIDGVNVAGEVNQILFRNSGGYFPLFMSNVYAESIFQFGFWQSFVGDRLSNSVIDFSVLDELPKAQYEGGGVTLTNVLTRIYGTNEPIVFMGNKKQEKGWWTLENVKITESLGVEPKIVMGYQYSLPDGYQESDFVFTDVDSINYDVICLDNSNTFWGYKRNGNKSIGLKGNYKMAKIK